MTAQRGYKLAAVVTVLFLAALAGYVFSGGKPESTAGDIRTVRVERRHFSRIVHRTGALQPLKEETLFARVGGTIKELIPQGSIVKKGQLLMKIEDQQFLDNKEDLEANIRAREAENEKARQGSAEQFNQAKQDVIGYELRLDLETMRLGELKKGPSLTPQINAETDVKSNEALLAAATDTYSISQDLADHGYMSREDARAKKLAMEQQRSALTASKIALQRLDTLDPIAIAAQELSVHNARKTLTSAKEKVVMLEANIARDEERFSAGMENLKSQLKKRIEDLDHCICTAPGEGVVVYAKGRWYDFAPGRQVWDGVKVMSIPDFSKLKVALTIDEARVSEVHPGQAAEIRPAGWKGAPFHGKVTKVAEKGRDEFELFLPETRDISGTANRQVFDVTVEVEESSDVLRLGLRADVDIVTQQLDNALVVPRMALTKDAATGQMMVNVEAGSSVGPRAVKVVAQDEVDAVVDGVAEGDRVFILENRKASPAGAATPPVAQAR
jgi:HlyD family secretion protein